MTDIKKRTRAPKQLTPADILMQAETLPLSNKVAIFTELKKQIEDERKAMQEQIELINANVK
jgi:hypothetical protein